MRHSQGCWSPLTAWTAEDERGWYGRRSPDWTVFLLRTQVTLSPDTPALDRRTLPGCLVTSYRKLHKVALTPSPAPPSPWTSSPTVDQKLEDGLSLTLPPTALHDPALYPACFPCCFLSLQPGLFRHRGRICSPISWNAVC